MCKQRNCKNTKNKIAKKINSLIENNSFEVVFNNSIPGWTVDLQGSSLYSEKELNETTDQFEREVIKINMQEIIRDNNR